MPDNPLKTVAGWFALAIVLIGIVQVVPAANRPVTFVLGLIVVYLFLTHVEGTARMVNGLLDALALR